MDDSGYGSPCRRLDENVHADTNETKFKLMKSNHGAMSKCLAPYDIVARKDQTLAAAIAGSFTHFKVERRLFWTEVEGHSGEVAVNPFSFLCVWLKPGTSVQMEDNEQIFYNAKEFHMPTSTSLFFVKTDDRHQLVRITNVPLKLFKGKPICVVAMEGDTLQMALERDGRFKNVPRYKLHKVADHYASPPSISSVNASSYHNTVFSVAVKQRDSDDSRAGNEDNGCTSAKRDGTTEEEDNEEEEAHITGTYRFNNPPGSGPQRRKEMNDIIKKNAKSTLIVDRTKRKNYEQEIPRIAREQFAIREAVARPANLSKHIAAIFPSVGQITCGSLAASCFLVANDMVMTNNHVADDIRQIKSSSNRLAHAQTYVNFDYDMPGENDRHNNIELAKLDDPRNIYDEGLDYAFLALDSKAEGKIPLGDKVKRQVPDSGLLSIIGHPGGREKLDDTCVVIPKAERFQQIKERVDHEEIRCLENPTDCSRINPKVQCIHLYNPTMNIAEKNEVIASYDSSIMFHGSSGSPVINMSGEIVAIHSRGYSLVESKKKSKTSLLEYGFTFDAIIADLLRKGRSEKVKELFPLCDTENMDQS